MELTTINASYNFVDVIDVFSSVIWVENYFGMGDFELITDSPTQVNFLLGEDAYLKTDATDSVMFIELHKMFTDSEGKVKESFTGRSLESILKRRIVWEQTNLEGNFQDAIELLLNENIISADITNRRISNFVFEASTDPNITVLTIEKAQYFGQYVYDVISALCRSKNVGFKVRLSSDNNFVFSLYYGADRTYLQSVNDPVVFSTNNENLLNGEYLERKDLKSNVVLVAGEGEGTDRLTAVVTGNAIPGGGQQWADLSRVEIFSDAKDISRTTDAGVLPEVDYIKLLEQRGVETLDKNTVIINLDGQIDIASTMFVYNEDYFIGDIIQIEDSYGHTSEARITSVLFSEEGSGTTIYPTFVTV